jgi:uncharacterized protein (DUF934 family)
MPLIKDGRVVDDPWRFVADDEPLPAEGLVAVGLERWQREQNVLLARHAPLGLRLRPGQHPDAIAADVQRFELIALEFPKFTDGRAYSYARRLREQHGFAGELRAVGQVLRDQLLFMQRCGFDAFEVVKGDAVEAWLKALGEFSVFYQPVPDGRRPVWALRRRAAAAGRRAREEVDA